MGMFSNLNNLSKQQQSQTPIHKQSARQVTPAHGIEHASPLLPLSAPLGSRLTPAAENIPEAAIRTPSEPQKRQRVNERPNVRSNERTKIRHSFDIFLDQLLSLRDIAHERQHGTSRKVPLGDLVQEALDAYLRT